MRGLKYLLSIDRRFNKDKRYQYAFFFFLFLFSVVPFYVVSISLILDRKSPKDD